MKKSQLRQIIKEELLKEWSPAPKMPKRWSIPFGGSSSLTEFEELQLKHNGELRGEVKEDIEFPEGTLGLGEQAEKTQIEIQRLINVINTTYDIPMEIENELMDAHKAIDDFLRVA